MTNIQMGTVTLIIGIVILLCFALVSEARRHGLHDTIWSFLSWLWEFFVSAVVAVVGFVILVGLVWLVGFIINTIWSLF